MRQCQQGPVVGWLLLSKTLNIGIFGVDAVDYYCHFWTGR